MWVSFRMDEEFHELSRESKNEDGTNGSYHILDHFFAQRRATKSFRVSDETMNDAVLSSLYHGAAVETIVRRERLPVVSPFSGAAGPPLHGVETERLFELTNLDVQPSQQDIHRLIEMATGVRDNPNLVDRTIFVVPGDGQVSQTYNISQVRCVVAFDPFLDLCAKTILSF